MTNNPKGPFNAATDRRNQQPDHNHDGNIRYKDNTAPVLKPDFSRIPQKNLAPTGMKGIQTEDKEMFEGREDKKLFPVDEITITKGDPDKDLFISGKITTMPGYTWLAKVYDLPSANGIDGGTISKLDVRKDSELVAHYDRGWDIHPRGPENKQAVAKIQELFDGPEREFQPIAPKSPDKDRGHDR